MPKKDGTIWFISDFRELNKWLRRKPYPIPKVQDMLVKLEGFRYATSLDLNMGYYHIELSPEAKKLCTIILPFGKYEYQRLPMGVAGSPDIFQEKMSDLMQELEYVRVYLDDLLTITKGDFKDHLQKLERVLDKLNRAGLKVNAKKSFFGKGELEYLGYWITREGIQPVKCRNAGRRTYKTTCASGTQGTSQCQRGERTPTDSCRNRTRRTAHNIRVYNSVTLVKPNSQ